MLERERLESKKISKTNAVTSMLDYDLDPDDVHVGPSDHVPWLEDRKWCYIRMEGTTYGDVPLNAELKLEVWDSPNSAGVITDAIRCLKLGLDRGLKGTLIAPSSYFMKSPPIQIHDDIARQRVEAFIRGEDNETLVGTENLTKAQLKKLASAPPVARIVRAPVASGLQSFAAVNVIEGDPGDALICGGDDRAKQLSLELAGRVAERAIDVGPLEKLAVAAYASAVWIVAHVPARLARWVIGTGSQAGYLLWPQKRAWSNANFGRVAGLPPGDRRVRKLALGAYRQYAAYLVEIMRLESLSPDEAIKRVVQTDLDRINDIWQSAPGGLIFALGHVGNNEAVAAGVADRGWPISVVADDSSFPEMFDRFTRLREAWGVHVIPWRNLREIYSVLKRREMLALLIDWGYRSDGVPVRLFGA